MTQEQAQALTGSDGMFDDMVAGSVEQPTAEQEQSAEEGERLYAGKYKTPEELAAAYENLQRKLGMRASEAEEAAQEPTGYTPEQAAEAYGTSVAEAAERAGLDLAQWDAMVRAGEDTSTQRQALAKELGISEQVIEDYERPFRPQEEAAPAAADGVAALKALAGGDAGWQRLDAWATANLGRSEIEIFNQALADTTPGVAEFAVKSLVARSQGSAPETIEPMTGSAPVGDVFRSQAEITASRYAKDSQGNVRYETDAAYRDAHRAKIARSKLPI